MADILAFNLTQTVSTVGTFKPRQMNDPDLSTKLKLMGVDVSQPLSTVILLGLTFMQVASFGNFFADRHITKDLAPQEQQPTSNGIGSGLTANPTKVGVAADGQAAKSKIRRKGVLTEKSRDEPIKCLTYRDPFASVYKKSVWCSNLRLYRPV
jgi:nitrite reductase (NAD(P)H)